MSEIAPRTLPGSSRIGAKWARTLMTEPDLVWQGSSWMASDSPAMTRGISVRFESWASVGRMGSLLPSVSAAVKPNSCSEAWLQKSTWRCRSTTTIGSGDESRIARSVSEVSRRAASRVRRFCIAVACSPIRSAMVAMTRAMIATPPTQIAATSILALQALDRENGRRDQSGQHQGREASRRDAVRLLLAGAGGRGHRGMERGAAPEGALQRRTRPGSATRRASPARWTRVRRP